MATTCNFVAFLVLFLNCPRVASLFRAAAAAHKRHQAFRCFSFFPFFAVTTAMFHSFPVLAIQNVDVTLADFTECETVSMLGLLHEQKLLVILKTTTEAFSFSSLVLSVFPDANVLRLLPTAKRCSAHAPRKYPCPVWKTWIKNWTKHDFSFLFQNNFWISVFQKNANNNCNRKIRTQYYNQKFSRESRGFATMYQHISSIMLMTIVKVTSCLWTVENSHSSRD